MRLLVLSFYYSPDLAAGLVSCDRARRRAARARAAWHSYRRRDDVAESLSHVRPRRGGDGKLARTWTFAGSVCRRIAVTCADKRARSLHFARAALRYVAKRDYDLVFATSSRLMTAALGALIARRKRARLYLDIRDIFVDTIGDVLPRPLAWPLRQLLAPIERWTMRRADRINLVSRGFEEYFRARYPDRSFAWFTNGIDDEFLVPRPAESAPPRARDARVTILYAGNIGEGQALHKIVPGLAQVLRGRADLVVIGDGGRRAALELAVAGIDNVQLRPPVSRGQLLDAYRSADVLFLHLGALPAFEKVLPSKVFEYAALGKPVLAGVAGYAARFIREEIANAAVFTPCAVSSAVAAFESLELAERPRQEFVAKYARATHCERDGG